MAVAGTVLVLEISTAIRVGTGRSTMPVSAALSPNGRGAALRQAISRIRDTAADRAAGTNPLSHR